MLALSLVSILKEKNMFMWVAEFDMLSVAAYAQ